MEVGVTRGRWQLGWTTSKESIREDGVRAWLEQRGAKASARQVVRKRQALELRRAASPGWAV